MSDDRLFVYITNEPWRSASDFSNVAHGCVIDWHGARGSSTGVPCGEIRRHLNRGCAWRMSHASQNDVGARLTAGMEPDVIGRGQLECNSLVHRAVRPYQDRKAIRTLISPWLGLL